MRKGLTWTLMTVLVAGLSVQAMASAPTISGLRDVVIGDAEGSSADNVFVYPDAFNILDAASDVESAAVDLVWSYGEVTDTILINGVPELGVADPIAPGASDLSAGTDPLDGDAASNTVTFRNNALSDITTNAGAGPYADPAGGPGIVDSTVVTMFVSDGEDVTSESIIVYSDDNGLDRLSPSTSAVPVADLDFSADGAGAWQWEVSLGLTGITSSTNGGLCMTAPLTGTAAARWFSPYGGAEGIDLVANNLYRVRMTMSSSQSAGAAQPLWSLTFINSDEAATNAQGANAHGGDFWVLGQSGGANAVGTAAGRTVYDVYYAPIQTAVAGWQTFLNDAANADEGDLRMFFRMFDIPATATGDYGADSDEGEICIATMTVDRFPVDSLVDGAEVYGDTDMTDGWAFIELVPNATSFADSGTDVLMTPGSAGWGGDAFTAIDTTPDGFPIQIEADTLYRMDVTVAAENAAAAGNGPEYIRMLMFTESSELFADYFMLNRAGSGATDADVVYSSYFYSHNVTLEANDGGTPGDPSDDVLFDGLKPAMQIGSLQGESLGSNDGGLLIKSVSVTKVTAQ